MPTLATLDIGDAPEVWSSIGFAVDGLNCVVDGVVHRLGCDGSGVIAWALGGLDGPVPVAGLPSTEAATSGSSGSPHANGVVALDHLVVSTPDLDRTIEDLESRGIELRRVRDAGRGARQAFFKLGDVVLEIVGAPNRVGDAPRFWGLAFTVADLDATAAFLGDRLRPAKDAVQPGRRIATLDRAAGSTVPIAFMSA